MRNNQFFMNTNLNHFQNAEFQERLTIQNIFNNYYQSRGCTSLKLTEIDSFAPYDFTFVSGSCRVVAEIKNRDISVTKFNDSIIELTKYKSLREEFDRGAIPLYIVRYNDCYCIFNLTESFNYETRIGVPVDWFFDYVNCASTGERNGKTKDKALRGLQFRNATILNYSFQPVPLEFLYIFFG